eukprot:5852320-Amphidinium_carterae.1
MDLFPWMFARCNIAGRCECAGSFALHLRHTDCSGHAKGRLQPTHTISLECALRRLSNRPTDRKKQMKENKVIRAL